MDVLFDNFGFRELWTPELIVPLVIVGIIYFLLITKWRHRFQGSSPVPLRKKVFFVSGLVALYLGWGSPLYIAGHMMISFHMIQMVFAYFIATPLFLLGLPSWLLQALINRFKNKVTVRIFRVLWSPITALFLFNFLFSVYHLPIVFDTLMHSKLLESVYYNVLLVASLLMWWHMIAPIPRAFPLSDLRRIGYIFANGILITPACALIIFAPNPLYQTYTDATFWAGVMALCLPAGAEVPMELFAGPGSFSFLETRMDQQLAGVLMKIMQEITYGITVGYVFRQWLSKEKQQDGELTISDIPVKT